MSSPVKRLQTGFVISSEKVTKTMRLRPKLSLNSSNKVACVMSNLEDNVSLAQKGAFSEADSDHIAKGGKVNELKSAFEILMRSRGGDTLRKTPGKRTKK